MKLQAEKDGVVSSDPAIRKQELHNKLSNHLNYLVNKIQMKHESLIDKQR